MEQNRIAMKVTVSRQVQVVMLCGQLIMMQVVQKVRRKRLEFRLRIWRRRRSSCAAFPSNATWTSYSQIESTMSMTMSWRYSMLWRLLVFRLLSLETLTSTQWADPWGIWTLFHSGWTALNSCGSFGLTCKLTSFIGPLASYLATLSSRNLRLIKDVCGLIPFEFSSNDTSDCYHSTSSWSSFFGSSWYYLVVQGHASTKW